MTLNLPNILSILRVLVSPLFLYLLISQDSLSIQISCYLYIFGAFTDYADGWLARKYSMITSWGVFFDPLADKILTTSAFIGFAMMGLIPWFLVVVIFIRDSFTTALRIIADNRNRPIKTSFSAKLKTMIQMLLITFILVLIYLKSFNGKFLPESTINEILNSQYMLWSLVLLTLFTIWTLIEYLYQNRVVISEFFPKKSLK